MHARLLILLPAAALALGAAAQRPAPQSPQAARPLVAVLPLVAEPDAFLADEDGTPRPWLLDRKEMTTRITADLAAQARAKEWKVRIVPGGEVWTAYAEAAGKQAAKWDHELKEAGLQAISKKLKADYLLLPKVVSFSASVTREASPETGGNVTQVSVETELHLAFHKAGSAEPEFETSTESSGETAAPGLGPPRATAARKLGFVPALASGIQEFLASLEETPDESPADPPGPASH